MKLIKTLFPIFIVTLVFVTFFSCSSQQKRSRKPVSTLTILPEAQNYVYGNNISVRVETKLRDGEIENIQLYYEGTLLKETSEMNFTVSNIVLNKTGRNRFHVVAVKTDEVSNTRSAVINVVSDVVPKKYTYTILRDFPHNRRFFTQGLEFYNGYLYEGTGEYGQSGLYKLNLNTGNIIIQHKLPEKYFGEGITILNEKIYQLTYRAQKGFVYDLNNFAVIDSFSYRSQEGWGLTNDGKYLIMSNGTHELIWIDPVDYSEVKIIDVVNNMGLMNYLNELEYIDGTIFANVFTTSMIVQIDPVSGKVLSEVNLDGIINMYTNPSDTIDYLNGIAYDSENNRLFVTGKLWPRLFHIELVESE